MLGQEPLLLTPMRHFHIFRVDRLMLDHRLIFLFMGNSLELSSLRSQLECRRHKTSVAKSYMLSICYINSKTL
jgi:hypothetical protein